MTLNHVHIYAKFKNRPGYFKCLDPQCIHFIERELVINKLSRCTSCGAEFVLTREMARRAMPRCLNCANTKEAKKFRATKILVDGIFNGIFKGVE